MFSLKYQEVHVGDLHVTIDFFCKIFSLDNFMRKFCGTVVYRYHYWTISFNKARTPVLFLQIQILLAACRRFGIVRTCGSFPTGNKG